VVELGSGKPLLAHRHPLGRAAGAAMTGHNAKVSGERSESAGLPG
jgi:hypothetical protein